MEVCAYHQCSTAALHTFGLYHCGMYRIHSNSRPPKMIYLSARVLIGMNTVLCQHLACMLKERSLINQQRVADIGNCWQNQTGRYIADLMQLRVGTAVSFSLGGRWKPTISASMSLWKSDLVKCNAQNIMIAKVIL